MALLEVCVDSVAGVQAAVAGGADRIELCAALSEGGLTPSAGFVQWACQTAPIPIMVMIRPRGGDFVYREAELAIMERDIAVARQAGAAGVVLGCLTADRRIDRTATARLIKVAAPLSITFHRAFDLVSDPVSALNTLIELGVSRLLTSGQAASAPAGMALINDLIRQAAERLIILPGSGLRPENVAALIAATGVQEVHASCSGEVSTGQTLEAAFGTGVVPKETSEAVIEALKRALPPNF